MPGHGAAWSPHRGHTHDGALANDAVVTGSPSHLHHEHGVQARVSLRWQGSMKVAMVFGGPPETHCRRPRSAHHLTLKCRMVGPLGGAVGDPGAPDTYVRDIDGGPHGRRCRRPGSTHHLCRRRRWRSSWEALSEIWGSHHLCRRHRWRPP
jgi:hypothetical protein